ncbi:hypothetical protein [Escherichia coli]|uniref:hypothetical protein n=1 Tax=Escherichia coli TaxID=562 RepID=UPI002036EB9F|nr:hypothetical protein [Escherichia coli]
MIYTTGTIAINGNTVTGTGTDFSAPVSLIRVGCTLIAIGNPVQIFTITEIKSGTELSVTPAADPAISAGTKFSILLSDSLSVDGLAQDVAETLRYYQGRETEIAEAIEFFREFDFNALTELANQIHTDSAQVSADKAIVQQYKTDSESAKSNAESAKDQAVLAQTAAETANTNAQAASTAAQEFRDQAEEWAQSVNADNLLTKSGNLAGLADRDASWGNLMPSGALRVGADPIADLDATTKRWVAINTRMNEHIAGLNVDVTSTDIKVHPGECYIPSEDKILRLDEPKTIAHSGLTAATKYYIYAYNDNGSLGIEVSTTENIKYGYKASHKIDDTSRRFIGMFYFTGGSEVAICKLIDGECIHLFAWGGTGRVLNKGTATTDAPVNYEKFVPLASFTSVKLVVTNTTTTLVSAYITPVGYEYVTNVQPYYCRFLIDLLPSIAGGGTVAYKYNSAPQDDGGFFIDVAGYKYDR